MRSNWPALLGCLMAFSAVQPCAAKTGSPKAYVDEKTRDIVGGRKVLVIIAQDKLLPGIDSWDLGWSNVANLIEHGIDRGLTARGGKEIAPITEALQGYDFDTPMKQALIEAAGSADWIRAQDIEFTRNGSNAAVEEVLNAANTRQMLMLRASYQTDWRYTSIVVSVEASLLVRQIPKGQHSDARLKDAYIPYRQTFRSIVNLPGADGTMREANVTRWAADGANLARRALDIGLRRIPPLLVQNLREDEQASAAWRKRNKRMTVTRSRAQGWIIGPQDSGVLFVEARTGAIMRLQALEP
ncbi:MAG: hypothetical protein ABI821_14715 [Pseudomonadota bacterium]